MGKQATEEGHCGALTWAVHTSPYKGQRRSGDGFLVQATPDGIFVAVVDGLGHGAEAADVTELALASLRQTVGQPLVACVTDCHRALRGTRGAAMTLAALNPRRRQLTWVAVGNVEAAVIVRGDGRGRVSTRSAVPLRGGVVGDRLPPLRESSVPLTTRDVLVSATDGLAPQFVEAVDAVNLSMEPPALARHLHRMYARPDDDALVLVGVLDDGQDLPMT